MNTSSRQTPSRLTASVLSQNNPAGFPECCSPPLSPTWSHHDFVFLGADAQEGEVVLGVDVAHGAPGLHDEAVHEAGVLDGAGVVDGALDGNTCRAGTAGLRDKPPGPALHWAPAAPTSAATAPRSGGSSLKARGKHEEKQNRKKLRWGTTGVGENCLPLVAPVLYFFILRVKNRNKLNKKKSSVKERRNTNVGSFFS